MVGETQTINLDMLEYLEPISVRATTVFSVNDILICFPISIEQGAYTKEVFCAIVNDVIEDGMLIREAILFGREETEKLMNAEQDGQIEITGVISDVSFEHTVDSVDTEYGFIKSPVYSINKDAALIIMGIQKKRIIL